MESNGVDAAALVIPGVFPHRWEDIDRRHVLDGVEAQCLVKAAYGKGLWPHDKDAVGAEQRDVVIEPFVNTHGALEQCGTKAELHQNEEHCECDPRQRNEQSQRLVPKLQPTKR